MRYLFPVVALAFVLCGCPSPEGPGPNLNPEANAPGEHWLRIAHLSDVHIVDGESPARSVLTDNLIAVSWRPQEDYSVQIFDATLQVLNSRHEEGKKIGRPVDFALVTGDMTDLGQHNELRWFMDTIDGKDVLPDSGDPDGAQRSEAPEDNPKLLYHAAGISKDIPWYTVYGNHDGLSVGNFGIDRSAPDPVAWNAPLIPLVAGILGLHRLNGDNNTLQPTAPWSPAVLLGSVELLNPATLQLPLDSLQSGPIVSDSRRHFLSEAQFVEANFNSATPPPGHGLTEDNQQSGNMYYTVRPKADVPVRLIVMDTVAHDPPFGLPIFYGIMTRDQFENFVKPAVLQAKAAGEYVILASHHPAADFALPYVNKVGTDEFHTWLTAQGNVIAHLAGHTHRNRVGMVDGKYPYIEIETCAIIDYPQEGRMLDIFYDGATKTIRLESTMFSHMENPTRLSKEGYRRASLDAMQAKSGNVCGEGDFRKYIPDIAKLYGEEYVDPDAEKSLNEPLTMADRYGRDEDRNFSVTLGSPASPPAR